MKIRNLMLALAGTALVFSACEKDPNPKVPTTDANIALATILPNPDGMTGAAYLQLIRDEFPQNTITTTEFPSVRRIIPDYRRERYFRFSGIHGR